ncbi:MAG: LOG family protein [Anaerolineales bacterium]|nr:LOG family protein [Anaerolineales bacterium]
MNITVFGGSQPKPGETAYDNALRLGKLLAEAGCAVLTGGYIGTMEAVSRGAFEAGGHVIGVTCDQIEAWRPVAPNDWVIEEIRYATVKQRLFGLIEKSDAAVALPGGIGTLAEISVMWSHLQTGALPQRPLILIGEGWKETIETFYLKLGQYINKTDLQWVEFAPDVDQAVRIIQTRLHTSA